MQIVPTTDGGAVLIVTKNQLSILKKMVDTALPYTDDEPDWEDVHAARTIAWSLDHQPT